MTDASDKKVFETTPDGQTAVKSGTVDGDSGPTKRVDPMSFSTHILSLNMTALMHLGVVDGLAEGERDQQAARHIVDTLQMLKQKTTGNLASDEESLLSTLIHELKLKIVQAI